MNFTNALGGMISNPRIRRRRWEHSAKPQDSKPGFRRFFSLALRLIQNLSGFTNLEPVYKIVQQLHLELENFGRSKVVL